MKSVSTASRTAKSEDRTLPTLVPDAELASASIEASKRFVEQMSDAHVEEMIRTQAYFRAERRGFEPGAEQEDWYQAEQEVRGALASAIG